MTRYEFAEKLIGKPHVLGGRTFSEVDCWGLVHLYYKYVLDINLPDWDGTSMSLKEVFRTLTNESKSRIRWLDKPQDDAILFGYRGNVAVHVGVYFSNGVLHCYDKGSVVYQRAPIAQITFGSGSRYGVPL